jgi:hypothetical protein
MARDADSSKESRKQIKSDKMTSNHHRAHDKRIIQEPHTGTQTRTIISTRVANPMGIKPSETACVVFFNNALQVRGCMTVRKEVIMKQAMNITRFKQREQ